MIDCCPTAGPAAVAVEAVEAVVVVVVVFIGGVEVVGSVETAVVAVIGVVEHSSVLQCCPIAGPTVVAAVGAVEVVLVVVGSVELSRS